MKKNKLLLLMSGVIILICLFLIIWFGQRNRKLQELRRTQELRNTTEIHLKQEYPQLDMHITDFVYMRRPYQYSGTIKANNNLRYMVIVGTDGNINHLELKDEKIIKDLKNIIEARLTIEFLNIKESTINCIVEPIAQDNSSYHKVHVLIQCSGPEISTEQFSQGVVAIRDEFIGKTRDKYLLEHLNIQYSYYVNGEGKSMYLHIKGQSMNYTPEQMVHMITR